MYQITDEGIYAGILFEMTLTESENQESLFSPRHTKFDGILKAKGEEVHFPYQCNVNYIEPSVKDILSCLILDKFSYDTYKDDLDGFFNEFGFTSVVECLKVYESCKNTSEALDKMFTPAELEKLQNIEDMTNEQELEER